jgi:alpha-tubulin suppressor-like RCC1 family protein
MRRVDVRIVCVLVAAIGVTACHKKKAAPLSAASTAVPATHDLVVAGGFDTCARRADGAFWCWGENAMGQLGDGSTTSQTSPVKMIGSESFESVSLSGEHTCALTNKHVVRCWGHNLYGEAGSPALVMNAPATDVLDDVVQVSAGSFVTCVVRGDKTVWCWGMNEHSQLADGTTTDRFAPRPVPGLRNAARVSVGDGTVCSLSTVGEVSCWGSNDYGTCGVGRRSIHAPHTFGKAPLATPVPTLIELDSHVIAKSVVLGGFDACFVANDATLSCWGEGSYGALGNGGTSNADAPQALSWSTSVDAVSVGGFGHACARRVDGTVWCWGYAIGSDGGERVRPEAISGLVVTELALGHTHACGRRPDGVVMCWGNNSEGQLGDGTYKPSARPITILSP